MAILIVGLLALAVYSMGFRILLIAVVFFGVVGFFALAYLKMGQLLAIAGGFGMMLVIA